MTKYERLLNLYLALYAAEQPLGREDLFRRLPEAYTGAPETARRAFERDKDALRQMGIPIVTIEREGEDAHYRIDKSELEGPAVELETEELKALHVALAAVKLEGAADPESALWKLGGTLGEDLDGPRVSVQLDARLSPMFAAAAKRQTLSFSYKGEQREMEPWGVVSRTGNWYLVGWDRARQAERNFRVDRIDGEVRVGPENSFDRRSRTLPRMPRPWEMGEGDPVPTRVLVDAELVSFAEADMGADSVVERLPDGGAVFELQVTSLEGLRNQVLSYLDHAVVVAPGEMRQAVVAWLEGMSA